MQSWIIYKVVLGAVAAMLTSGCRHDSPESIMVSAAQVRTIPFSSRLAFDVALATSRLSEDCRTAGTIVDRDLAALDALIPGIRHYNSRTDAILWTYNFRPSRPLFAKGCFYVYGKPTKDENLRAIVVPRHFATDVACLETYED